MKNNGYILLFTFLITALSHVAQSQASPDKIKFVRQGVQRLIFDEKQSIHLAGIEPGKIIGLSAMHPISHYTDDHSKVIHLKSYINPAYSKIKVKQRMT